MALLSGPKENFMATLFLVVIYLAFISLGLPDSLLGSAWPLMQPDLHAPFSAAGVLLMVTAGGTIISSLVSGWLIERIGTGKITLISCILTAGALIGYSMSPNFWWLLLFAIPLGFGGGSVDTALNHYVAANYKAHHMNWLHCFWGVGATGGPIIMSLALHGGTWRKGYLAVALIQCSLVLVLAITLPLWKKVSALHEDNRRAEADIEREDEIPAEKHVFRIRGVKQSLVVFMLYCGVEATVGLWGASYLVQERGVAAETAAGFISIYYGGITLGRLATGFISMRMSNKALIRMGQVLAVMGGLLLFLPFGTAVALAGYLMIGLGLAPIYPGLIHETPERFGRANSARLIGFQMATAYTGTTFLPPLFGLVAGYFSTGIFPWVVLCYLVGMLGLTEFINRLLAERKKG